MNEALKNLHLYQQELEDMALAQRSPRLANIAAAIKRELRALSQPDAPRHADTLADLIAEGWQELLDKDDRTSPEDCPDMLLITREELADLMGRACWRGSARELAQATQVSSGPAVNADALRKVAERVAAYARRVDDGELIAEAVALTYASGKYGDDKRAFAADLLSLLSLATENERLREALGFYAARGTWLPGSDDFAAIVDDGGDRAREALALPREGDRGSRDLAQQPEPLTGPEPAANAAEVEALREQIAVLKRERNDAIARLSRMCGDA